MRPWHLLALASLAAVAAAVLPSLQNRNRQRDNEFHIVCDFLPSYVFALNVVGDTPGVSVSLLVPSNMGCPHDYTLRTSDMQRVADSNLFVVNGLGLDPYLQPLLRANPKIRVATLSDDTQFIATSQPGGPGASINPHTWVSPAHAARQVQTLARKLGQADPQHAGVYDNNAQAYVARLSMLLARMQQAAAGFNNRKIVTHHEAFDYLARDLGLMIVATLTDDPEQTPSASRIRDTIEVIRRTHPAAIFYEPAYSDALAKTVSRDTGIPIYPLNPFNTYEGQPGPGSYEQVMEANLQVLQKALGTSARIQDAAHER